MATCVIKFFLIIPLYVYKMDAEHTKELRALASLTQRRWSMCSQRLEEVVAELMRPAKDNFANFDTDLCGLLEEYCTEAGLRALGSGEMVTPNYAELAMLLQQSAIIYSRKVDFLHGHVIAIKNSLKEAAQDDNDNENGLSTEARRKRKSSVREMAEFCEVEVEAGGAGVRRGGAPGEEHPPPTLPRLYLELQPRVPHERDPALTDYAGASIGLLADFHAAWRLREGQLVEDLASTSCAPTPPATPPRAYTPPVADTPPASPVPPALPSLPSSPVPVPAQPMAKDRPNKRKTSEPEPSAFTSCIKIDLSIAAMVHLRRRVEYSVEGTWLRRVVARRAAEALKVRRSSQLLMEQIQSVQKLQPQPEPQLDDSDPDLSGVIEDDGFHEPSGSAGHSGCWEGEGPTTLQLQDWAERVVVEALEKEAKYSMDGPALRRLVQEAVPEPCAPPLPIHNLLLEHAQHPRDVSRIFYTTLTLAAEGSVQVCNSTPLVLGGFSVRASPPSSPHTQGGGHTPPPHDRAPC